MMMDDVDGEQLIFLKKSDCGDESDEYDDGDDKVSNKVNDVLCDDKRESITMKLMMEGGN